MQSPRGYSAPALIALMASFWTGCGCFVASALMGTHVDMLTSSYFDYLLHWHLVVRRTMQVIDRASKVQGWQWAYTHIPRISGNESMPKYEARLGRQLGSENSWANLFVSAEADYFIGALGSSWSLVIDGLRCTSGKLYNGFLSTSKDRHW